MNSQLCLHCGFGFLAIECENFVEEKDACEGCDATHCCRECGSYDTRPKEEKETHVHVDRALFQCGDCGLQFTQRECASHTDKYTPEENRWASCSEDCTCDRGAKNSIHRCPTCLTLNGHYAGLTLNGHDAGLK